MAVEVPGEDPVERTRRRTAARGCRRPRRRRPGCGSARSRPSTGSGRGRRRGRAAPASGSRCRTPRRASAPAPGSGRGRRDHAPRCPSRVASGSRAARRRCTSRRTRPPGARSRQPSRGLVRMPRGHPRRWRSAPGGVGDGRHYDAMKVAGITDDPGGFDGVLRALLEGGWTFGTPTHAELVAAVDALPMAIWVSTVDGEPIAVSERWTELTGQTTAAWRAARLGRRHPPRRLRRVVAGGSAFIDSGDRTWADQYRIVHVDLRRASACCPTASSASTADGSRVFVGVTDDVTVPHGGGGRGAPAGREAGRAAARRRVRGRAPRHRRGRRGRVARGGAAVRRRHRRAWCGSRTTASAWWPGCWSTRRWPRSRSARSSTWPARTRRRACSGPAPLPACARTGPERAAADARRARRRPGARRRPPVGRAHRSTRPTRTASTRRPSCASRGSPSWSRSPSPRPRPARRCSSASRSRRPSTS